MKVKELIEELQKCNPEDYVKMGLHDIEYIAPMVDGGVFVGDCGYPRICPNCGNALVYTESFYGDSYICPNCDETFSEDELNNGNSRI